MSALPAVMTLDEIAAFLDEVFPQIDGRYSYEALTEDGVIVALQVDQAHLRPGGTVSGPTMFALADLAFYAATLSRIGPEALTVTTSATINYLRKPSPDALLATARILKLGRSLCVGDVLLTSGDDAIVVAHASITYAIPPR